MIRPFRPPRKFLDLKVAALPDDIEERARRYFPAGRFALGGLISHVRHEFTNYPQLVKTVNGGAFEMKIEANDLVRDALADMGFNAYDPYGWSVRRERKAD